MIYAWIGAAAVGLSLGLFGAGGAILAVPILVILLGHDEKAAVVESLAIVAAIAAAGAIRAAIHRRVDWAGVLLLAAPGIVGAAAGAHAAKWVPGAVQLLLLGALMAAAAVKMAVVRPAHAERRPPLIWVGLAQGFGLGVITGLIGVGGGFLIVPVLVVLRRVEMPLAVGTSLAIITVNSLAGLTKYLAATGTPGIDWQVVVVFAVLGIAGSFAGGWLGARLPQATLRRLFAAFLIVMSAYLLYRQAPRVLISDPPGLTDSKETGNLSP